MQRTDIKVTSGQTQWNFTIEYTGGVPAELAAIDLKIKELNIPEPNKVERYNYRTVLPVEKVKKGTLIRLRDAENANTYIRGEYSSLDWPKGKGRFCCTGYNHTREDKYLKKGRLVIIDFEY